MLGPGKMSPTLLLFGSSVILMVVQFGLGHALPTPDNYDTAQTYDTTAGAARQPPMPDNYGTAQTVPEDIVAEQPLIHIPPEDLEKNAGNPRVKYCLSGNRDATYYTYVYVWSFSDSPAGSRVLGYPSHRWDYEPIIVRIDKESLKKSYIYDAGHYRARSTSNDHFVVVAGSHWFKPSQELLGERLGSEQFEQLTSESLKLINSRLETLARIPFRPGLSLSWACNTPWEVERTSAFSGPTAVGSIPRRVNGIAGLCIGLIAVAVSWIVVRMVRDYRTWHGFRIASCGLCGGIVGGVVGFEAVFAMASSSVPGIIATILGILAGLIAGTSASVLVGTIARGKILSALVVGGISSLAATILTVAW